MKPELPAHLRRYVVEQDDRQYTPVDQAVWRFVLRQLRSYLSVNAHPAYLEGLEKTGIGVESIPRISDISEKISLFGWRAMPVSGFIPPAAFMELQALGVLPIASDMRSIDHLQYTPAPDIVHEAAGHAPMLAYPEFAEYLKRYAQVARRAIISKEDMDLYAAIRELSDLKEDPSSTPEAIKKAEARLDRVTKSVSHVSEATWLSRMNWWTAEYGLFGSIENPKIYGAGLLSSVGEARLCLSDRVVKIPMSIECIDFTYDITEPQPQLFVTPDFATLNRVLDQLADRMAFRIGGVAGVKRAIQAATVNTVELDSGVQVSGKAIEVLTDENEHVAYLRFEGPTQLSIGEKQLPGHGKDYHAHGFGTPVGLLKDHSGNPATFTDAQWSALGAKPGGRIRLEYASGVVVTGDFAGRLTDGSKTIVLSLENAKAVWGDRLLFDPSWGTFDIAVGSSVPSVFGGPADRGRYGETDDFVAARVPRPVPSEKAKRREDRYRRVREWREGRFSGSALVANLGAELDAHLAEWPHDWLLVMEIYELALNRGEDSAFTAKVRARLDDIVAHEPSQAGIIKDGLTLAADID